VTFGNGFRREKMSMFVDFSHGFSGLIYRVSSVLQFIAHDTRPDWPAVRLTLPRATGTQGF
jgi:hypothetical protein